MSAGEISIRLEVVKSVGRTQRMGEYMAHRLTKDPPRGGNDAINQPFWFSYASWHRVRSIGSDSTMPYLHRLYTACIDFIAMGINSWVNWVPFGLSVENTMFEN